MGNSCAKPGGKRRIEALLISLIGLAVLSILLFWLTQPQREPVLPDPLANGKRTSQWVREAVRHGDWQTQATVAKIGEPAIPYIVKNLRRKDSMFNTAWVWLWPKLPGAVQRRVSQPTLARETRMNAVVALREMGPKARNAVPDLIERLSDPGSSIRLHSAIALGNLGPAASDAVPHLKPLLASTNHTVRVYTANALWKITKNKDLVLPVLSQGIKQQGAPFRWAAAVFLGEMGLSALSAVPELEAATEAPDKETASCAIQALAQIGPQSVSTLEARLHDPDPAIRISAAFALENLGQRAASAIPELKKLLNDQGRGSPTIMGRGSEVVEVRRIAADAIAKIEGRTEATAGQQ